MKMDCGTLLVGLFIVCGSVSALSSQPVIRMDGFQGTNIRLRCKTSSSSSNHQISWKDGDGNKLASSNSEETENPKGVFTVISHIDIAKDSKNKYTCLVQTEGMKTEGEAVIQISGELFPKEPSLSSWQIAFIVILIFSLIPFIAIIILIYRRKLSQELKTKIEELKAKIEEWKKITKSAVSVTMDPNAAHPELTVAETSVEHRTSPETDTKQRFDRYPHVLGCNKFASGQHYWAVEVGEKLAWDIGVAQESIDVKNTTNASSSNEYWALRKEENEYKAVSSGADPRSLSLRQMPEKIGVYLDFEKKTLSFYNADNTSHLYTFTVIVTEKLCPLFSPGLNQGGKNSEPLKICPKD